MHQKKSITKINAAYHDQYDAYVERQKRKKKRLFRRLILFATIVALIVGSMVVFHYKQRSLYADKQVEYQHLQEELANLNKDEENFQEEIKLLNDEEYILEIARTKYFLSKEGELIFKTPDDDTSY